MNFRNVIIALACMALFAGLAGAQGQTLTSIPCTVAAASAPTIRTEGVTERVGDVVISCGYTTNNTVIPTNGQAVTRGNLLVDFGAPITSRQDGDITATYGRPSEILMLINDPGATGGPVAGYGQNAAISVCTAKMAQADVALELAGNGGAGALGAATNCPTYYQDLKSAGGIDFWELDKTGTSTGQAANAYQGGIGGNSSTVTIPWTANQVLFQNVPILTTFSSSQTNFFRIVNARVNASGVSTITASFTPTTLTETNGTYLAGSAYSYSLAGAPTLATATSGLNASINALSGVSLCAGTTLATGSTTLGKANLAILTFKENFAGAFKTRTLSLTGNQSVAAEATGPQPLQNAPSGTYTVSNIVGTTTNKITMSAQQSESDFITSFTSNAATLVAGQADFGTRLKAVFTNLDPNTSYYVTVNPIIDYSTNVTLPLNPLTGAAFTPGDATPFGYAVLQAKGTASNGSAASETAAYAAAPGDTFANGGPSVSKLLLTKKSDGTYTAEAVWEITNVVPGAPQTLNFGLYGVYNITSVSTTPAVGNGATVQLGYAPTASSTVTTNIPRFAAPAMTAAKFDNILPCQTSLLFPYVVGNSGFNTGLAISNTSADPYSTPTSTGACSLSFYSSVTPATYPTPTVAPGTTYTALLNTTNQLSDSVGTATLTGFAGQGYMIATCNFQYAHGFAFIDSAPGQPAAMAMGYVANVMASTTRGQSLGGEALDQ